MILKKLWVARLSLRKLSENAFNSQDNFFFCLDLGDVSLMWPLLLFSSLVRKECIYTQPKDGLPISLSHFGKQTDHLRVETLYLYFLPKSLTLKKSFLSSKHCVYYFHWHSLFNLIFQHLLIATGYNCYLILFYAYPTSIVQWMHLKTNSNMSHDYQTKCSNRCINEQYLSYQFQFFSIDWINRENVLILPLYYSPLNPLIKRQMYCHFMQDW